MSSGMANGQKLRNSGMESGQGLLPGIPDESGQGLLPGIPDEITMTDIASKLKWEICNVMQMVSREWRHAICSRSVYDARVLLDSTDAFLVLAYFFDSCNKRGLTLYSCTDGTFLRLPPIPGATGTCTHPYFECICLDGRIYLWEPVDCPNEPPVLWVLDLAGDRRWTKREREQVKCWRSVRHFHVGVLDGKIFRFRGNTRVDRRVLEAGGGDIRQNGRRYIQYQLESLPQTEVYDLHSNVWSNITPERPSARAPNDDLDRRILTNFSEWESEQLQADPSTLIGRYEPFYSEWRDWHSTTVPIHKNWSRRHALATQVYDTNFPIYLTNRRRNKVITEKILFFQENLVKVIQHKQVLGVDIQAYDTEKKAWELWKSFPAPHGHFGRRWVGHPGNSPGIHSCVFADNIMWALASVRCVDDVRFDSEVRLMKRPLLLNSDISGDSAGWIDTGFSMVQFNPSCSEMRPIYL